jgi:hypothetical protein
MPALTSDETRLGVRATRGREGEVRAYAPPTPAFVKPLETGGVCW